ncbi:MAG: type I-B CRISPR-associated protein Cas7/Cst2/DevR [Acidobacteria bacterium]|nr:type I-B CRISPR-associated protein Cas7/Cst2/DevR [Acidobacteriota bacterium]
MPTKYNLFATVLTYPAPSSNYRGESEENRTVLQKINKGGKNYPVISSDAMRNALREILAKMGLPCNRKRLHDKKQLAVEYTSFPDAFKFIDDFFFGFMIVDSQAIAKHPKLAPKRVGVLRMNMAVATSPYRHDATFHQAPLNAGQSPWQNAKTVVLLHRETNYTAFQYAFALSGEDCKQADPKWSKGLLEAIGQLNGVAGGHSRNYYEMAPASIVIRLTPSLIAGFNTYGFTEAGEFPELSRISSDDLPGNEFWLAGEIVRNMGAEEKLRLKKEGVKLQANPQKLLAEIADHWLEGKE